MSEPKSVSRSCVPLDRSPAAVALALVLGLMIAIVAIIQVANAETEATCESIVLEPQTTAAGGGPVALADITICYRPLPMETDLQPILKAEPATVSGPVGSGDRI